MSINQSIPLAAFINEVMLCGYSEMFFAQASMLIKTEDAEDRCPP